MERADTERQARRADTESAHGVRVRRARRVGRARSAEDAESARRERTECAQRVSRAQHTANWITREEG
jgi:hypothetical protein